MLAFNTEPNTNCVLKPLCVGQVSEFFPALTLDSFNSLSPFAISVQPETVRHYVPGQSDWPRR